MAEATQRADKAPVEIHVPDTPLSAQFAGSVGAFQLAVQFKSHGLSTAVFGRSGAGKTSLIHMLAGLKTPERGRIVLGNTVVFDSDAGLNMSVDERRVGLVFQDARLFPHMNVLKNLTYSHWAGKRVSTLSLERVTDLLALEPLLDRVPATLSGGEKQRVAIGRALLSNPRILLLDEPLASLDNARKLEILPFLEHLAHRANIPICYVSHSMDEVCRLADDMVVMTHGRTEGYGPLPQMLTRLDLGGAAGRHEAGAMLEARVVLHDAENGLTQLELATTPPQRFELALMDVPQGARVRLRVRARDISLSLEHVRGISIRNQLAAIVERIQHDDQGYAEVVLVLGDPKDKAAARLRARITKASAKDLKLQPGQAVVALVKTIAIERRLLQTLDHPARGVQSAKGSYQSVVGDAVITAEQPDRMQETEPSAQKPDRLPILPSLADLKLRPAYGEPSGPDDSASTRQDNSQLDIVPDRPETETGVTADQRPDRLTAEDVTAPISIELPEHNDDKMDEAHPADATEPLTPVQVEASERDIMGDRRVAADQTQPEAADEHESSTRQSLHSDDTPKSEIGTRLEADTDTESQSDLEPAQSEPAQSEPAEPADPPNPFLMDEPTLKS